MPAKNRIKEYAMNAWYHLYNRGVDKQPIFRDDQDYAVFLSYLKTYLEPKDEEGLRSVLANPTASWREKDISIKLLLLNNFFEKLDLLAYCLMLNHFHFLVYQSDANMIDQFLNSLGTRYTMYINKKYKRIGPLFQGVYKAVRVVTDEQLLYLTRYIHRNPLSLCRKSASQGQALRSWTYSSYHEYLLLRETSWVKPEQILTHFGKKKQVSYQSFVEGEAIEELATSIVGSAGIDS